MEVQSAGEHQETLAPRYAHAIDRVETASSSLDKFVDAWIAEESVVAGDIVRFKKVVFRGPFCRARCIGRRAIVARVLRESYGALKQQHTLTVEVVSCDGIEPIAAGSVIRRKGRVLYRKGVKRPLWADEAARLRLVEEKRSRRRTLRDVARAARVARKEALNAAGTRRRWPSVPPV